MEKIERITVSSDTKLIDVLKKMDETDKTACRSSPSPSVYKLASNDYQHWEMITTWHTAHEDIPKSGCSWRF